MSEKNQEVFVVADADEGVQLNSGVRLGFAGSGFHLSGFDQVIGLLKTLFSPLVMVASAENDWIKAELKLDDWEQVNAVCMQHVEALADKYGLKYAGFLPFADPKDLKYGVKGHMVRPKNVHLANKICLTLGGGEQTFNLGQFVLSADWVHLAKDQVVKDVLETQIRFYSKLVGQERLPIVYETEGSLGKEIAEKNLKKLRKLGIIND